MSEFAANRGDGLIFVYRCTSACATRSVLEPTLMLIYRHYFAPQCSGPALVEHLDSMPKIQRHLDLPIRLPVAEKFSNMGVLFFVVYHE
jgi:translation elongation factor EF-1alpha